MGVLLAVAAAVLSGAMSYDPSGSYSYRILDNPTSGDAFMFRGALQGYAQKRSDGMFNALMSLLGGSAPGINFVPTGSQFTSNHMSANGENIGDRPGAPLGTINMDPLAVNALISDYDPLHSGAVNQVPHEMAHTRQTLPVLNSTQLREGGAQAFANAVTENAARQANIPYTPGNFDGGYASYVAQVLAQKGQPWVMAGQFGR